MATKLKDIAVDQLIEMLETKQFKKKLVKKLNKNVDIPMLNERTEHKVFDAVYDMIVSALKELEDEKK